MRQIAKFIILFLVLSILSSLVSAYDYPYCGDGICNPDGSEDGWCSDCGVAPTPYCGDGVCDSGEAGWCSDCDVAPTPYCGDGVCDSGEAGWCSDCDVTPAPPCTPAAWSCTNWEPNVCPSNGIRTRTCTLIDTTCTNPNAVKPSETQSCTPGEEIEEEIINRNIRSDELLISSIIPDPEYAAPGDEILLYVSVKNEGKNRFKNLQITAMIKELGIKAVSSPFTLKERDTISKTLFFNIPHYAKPGLYYIKIEVASDSDHTARYRIFEVY